MTTAPNKPGRPHFDPANPLTERIVIRLSEQELGWLRKEAKGAKLATFARDVLRCGIQWMKRL